MIHEDEDDKNVDYEGIMVGSSHCEDVKHQEDSGMISLHALAGMSIQQTLRFQVRLIIIRYLF